MARMYPNTTSADHAQRLVPAASTNWTNTSAVIPHHLKSSGNVGSPDATAITVDNSSGTASTLMHSFTSDRLAPQTISGTVKGQFRMLLSSVTGCTAVSRIAVIVVDDNGVVLTTLATANGGVAITATSTNRKSPITGTTLSSYACKEGDRIVYEIGMVRTAGTTSRTGTIAVTVSGTEFPEDDTTTVGAAWIEFSLALVFLPKKQPGISGVG